MNPVNQFERLMGRYVSNWIGTELAVDQDEPIVWADLSCGYLQFSDLQSVFSDGTSEHWDAGLDDAGEHFMISLDASAVPLEIFNAYGDDFLRGRDVTELPTGRIELVKSVTGAYGQVVSVSLTIEGFEVTFSCGEATWECDELIIVKPQEFVLVELAAH